MRGVRRYTSARQSLFRRFTQIFLSVTLKELPKVAAFVREANRRHYLHHLLVYDPDATNLLPQFMARADLRSVRNLLVHADPAVPGRVLRAHAIKAEGQLIADARILDDDLVVIGCEGESFVLPFERVPHLRGKRRDEVRGFEVEGDGPRTFQSLPRRTAGAAGLTIKPEMPLGYITWNELDVHVDLQSVRGWTDPDAFEQARQDRLQADRRFGRAVADLRMRHGLRQADFPGLSARQIRRIEKGSRPRSSTLGLMAKSQGFGSVGDYLNAVAEAMKDM